MQAAAWDGVAENVCDEHEELRWLTPDEVAALPVLASPAYPALAHQALSASRNGR